MRDRGETCSTCPYYKPDPDPGVDDGECRRRAPTVVGSEGGDAYTYWPDTSPDDWCGEHPRFHKKADVYELLKLNKTEA